MTATLTLLDKVRADLAEAAGFFPDAPVLWCEMGAGTWSRLAEEFISDKGNNPTEEVPGGGGGLALRVGDALISIDLFMAEGALRVVRGPCRNFEAPGYPSHTL